MVFLSPRNTLEGHLNVLDSADCRIFASPEKGFPGISSILSARNFQHLVVPELDEWLDGPIAPHRPFLRTFEEIRHEPIVILHSSGTTSLPKPVAYTHGCIAASMTQLEPAANSNGATLLQLGASGKKFFNGFPLFHAGGMFYPLALALYAGVQIIFPPAGQPLNAGIVDLIHEFGDVQTSCLPPAILEDLSKNPSSLQKLRNVQYIITGGAPLPKSVGDIIQAMGPRIFNTLASTETGVVPTIGVAREDWQWVRFAPNYGIELRPHNDEEDLHELYFVRDAKLCGRQGVFENYPTLQEYSTQDLFRRHQDPHKSDHWIFCGRSDDVIVLLNGEKFSPVGMEKHIRSHSAVLSALVFGRDRVQASLLVEPRDNKPRSQDERQQLIEEIWPTIQQANRYGPAHGRLSKKYTLLTRPEKPMHRTSKGSVNRNITFKLYADEINTLYEAQAQHPVIYPITDQPNGSTVTTSSTKTEICSLRCQDMDQVSIRQLISQTASLDMDKISDQDDLFSLGMDSLHVLHLVHNISAIIGRKVDPSFVYMNPSIAELSNAFRSLSTGRRPSRNRAFTTKSTLKKYSLGLPMPKAEPARVAIVTGTKRGLGSFLLQELVRRGQFSKIYCLVRSISASSERNSDNVFHLQCDFADPQLGLGFDIYYNLLENATHILHDAWLVDFNLSLESFDVHLKGVRHLIDFSARSKHNAHIFFISSIGAVLNAPTVPVKETIFEDFDVAHSSGYGESKHVAERLLYEASLKSKIPSTICRLGQIAGPINAPGMWNRREWFPSLVTSSKYIGCIPSSLGSSNRIDWIPVNVLAKIIVELFSSEERSHASRVLHVVNPVPSTWPSLLPTIQKHLGGGVAKVPFPTWVDHLEASASKLENLDKNPAIKLLSFYREIAGKSRGEFPVLDTTNAQRMSPTLANLGPVCSEWMELWLKQWGL